MLSVQVGALLQSACVVPEAYASKWFIGLCVHVLPFEALFDFVEARPPTRKPVPCYCAAMRGARRPILGMRTLQAFLTEGFVFLFKFSLALIEKTSDKLLACKVSCAPGRSSCAPYHARTLVPWLPTGHCAQPLGHRRQCHLRDLAPRSRHLPGRPRRREVLH